MEQEDCDLFDFGCEFDNLRASIVERIKEEFATAVGDVIESMLTFWITEDTRNLEESTGGQGSADGIPIPTAVEHEGNDVSSDFGGTAVGTADLLGYVTWIGLGLAVLSLIILGAMLAVARSRGEGGQYLGKITVVLGSVALIGGASSLVTGLINTMGPSNAGGASGFLQSRLLFYVAIAATASVIVGGVKMAWEQRAQPGKELLKSLLTLVVVSACSVTFINLAIGLGDEFSVWIIDEAYQKSDLGNLAIDLADTLGFSALKGAGGGLVLVIILGLVILVGGLIQIVLMMIREGMLILLAGVLPLTAAFTNTEMGKSWFQKAISWLVAFLLYKPVAAIIYALVFVLLQEPENGEQDLEGLLLGVTMLFMAIFALPALMKFVTPMVGATAGGALAGGAASMVSQMPTGAGSGGGGGGGSGGGGGGGGGPTGGKSAPGGPSGGKTGSAGGTAGGTGAQTGAQAATQAGSSGAGSAAMKSNPKTAAIYAAVKTVKKTADQTKQAVDNTASGGDGPSGSK